MDTAKAVAPAPETTTPDEAIKVEDLHKSFGTLEVLKGVSLTANKGDVVAIIGGQALENPPCCAASTFWKRRVPER